MASLPACWLPGTSTTHPRPLPSKPMAPRTTALRSTPLREKRAPEQVDPDATIARMSTVWTNSEVAPVARQRKTEREAHKLEKRLCRLVGQAIGDYNMI